MPFQHIFAQIIQYKIKDSKVHGGFIQIIAKNGTLKIMLLNYLLLDTKNGMCGYTFLLHIQHARQYNPIAVCHNSGLQTIYRHDQ